MKLFKQELSKQIDKDKEVLNHSIDLLIKQLEGMKKDLPYSADRRVWNNFAISIATLYRTKGKLDGLYTALSISTVEQEV